MFCFLYTFTFLFHFNKNLNKLTANLMNEWATDTGVAADDDDDDSCHRDFSWLKANNDNYNSVVDMCYNNNNKNNNTIHHTHIHINHLVYTLVKIHNVTINHISKRFDSIRRPLGICLNKLLTTLTTTTATQHLQFYHRMSGLRSFRPILWLITDIWKNLVSDR